MATTRKSSKRASAKSPVKAVVKTVTPKASKLGYWFLTLLLTVPMLVFGFLAVIGNAWVVNGYTSLGYPAYLAVILGSAKVLGALAIITGRITWLKEWAYAGFSFDFIALIGSILAVYGFFTLNLLLPIAFLIVLYFSHHFWKRLSEIHGIAYTRLF